MCSPATRREQIDASVIRDDKAIFIVLISTINEIYLTHFWNLPTSLWHFEFSRSCGQDPVGTSVGAEEGLFVVVGDGVGDGVGVSVVVGNAVGTNVGNTVGTAVGTRVVAIVGRNVGFWVGEAVGA